MKPDSRQRTGRHAGIHIEEAPVSSLLLQVVRAHALLAAAMFAEVGLVPPQEVVILYLDDHGPCHQREIVRFMGRDRSTVTNTLQAMERAGLIIRKPSDADGRSLIVVLSDKGRKLAPKVREVWAEIEAKTTRELDREQLSALTAALGRLREGLAAALDGISARAP